MIINLEQINGGYAETTGLLGALGRGQPLDVGLSACLQLRHLAEKYLPGLPCAEAAEWNNCCKVDCLLKNERCTDEPAETPGG